MTMLRLSRKAEWADLAVIFYLFIDSALLFINLILDSP